MKRTIWFIIKSIAVDLLKIAVIVIVTHLFYKCGFKDGYEAGSKAGKIEATESGIGVNKV